MWATGENATLTAGDGREDVDLSAFRHRGVGGAHFLIGDRDHHLGANATGIDDHSAESGELPIKVRDDLAKGGSGGLHLGSAAGLTSEWCTDMDGGHAGV